MFLTKMRNREVGNFLEMMFGSLKSRLSVMCVWKSHVKSSSWQMGVQLELERSGLKAIH